LNIKILKVDAVISLRQPRQVVRNISNNLCWVGFLSFPYTAF